MILSTLLTIYGILLVIGLVDLAILLYSCRRYLWLRDNFNAFYLPLLIFYYGWVCPLAALELFWFVAVQLCRQPWRLPQQLLKRHRDMKLEFLGPVYGRIERTQQ